ncbi:hypothetical protein P9223_00510, partial [Geobacillus stearothermophilus]|nr:hypothetical protein [Geobacillus stearothermophilus]
MFARKLSGGSSLPQAAATKWAKVHFWLHNIGLPVMMIGLIFVVYGNEAFVPVTAIGGVLVG